MRALRLVRSLPIPVLSGLLLVACGGSSSSTATKAAATTTARAAGGATTTVKAAGGTATTAKAGAKADCTAVKSALGGIIVNWQLVAQFPRETDVTKWPERVASVGTLDRFASQLGVLQAQLGANADAAKAIAYMQGANDIVQKGLAGDAAAPQALATYLGTDLTAVLSRQAPIGIAASAAGC